MATRTTSNDDLDLINNIPASSVSIASSALKTDQIRPEQPQQHSID